MIETPSPQRERNLQHLFMTTKAWTALLVLTTLHASPVRLCGSDLLGRLAKTSQDLVAIPSSGLYPLLHQMERERFVQSVWEEREHPGVRHRRFYALTPAGEERYQRLRREMQDACLRYRRFMTTAVQTTQSCMISSPGEDLPLSIQTFLRFWLLYDLTQEDYALAMKRKVEARFPLWRINDGTLYPLLYEMEEAEWIQGRWGHVQEGQPLPREAYGIRGEPQSRAVRLYTRTPKGKRLLADYGSQYLAKLQNWEQRAVFTEQYVYG